MPHGLPRHGLPSGWVVACAVLHCADDQVCCQQASASHVHPARHAHTQGGGRWAGADVVHWHEARNTTTNTRPSTQGERRGWAREGGEEGGEEGACTLAGMNPFMSDATPSLATDFRKQSTIPEYLARKSAVILFGWVRFFVASGPPHVGCIVRAGGGNEIELTPMGGEIKRLAARTPPVSSSHGT